MWDSSWQQEWLLSQAGLNPPSWVGYSNKSSSADFSSQNLLQFSIIFQQSRLFFWLWNCGRILKWWRVDETSNSTDSQSESVCVSVRGWRCRGDAMTQCVSPEWKQRWPAAGFHTVSPRRPQALKNFFRKRAHTLTSMCVCLCVIGVDCI